MNFSLWMSHKLRLNAPGRPVNATGVIIAATGVALAVMVMEFTMAIVSGFKSGITEKLTGFDGQISVLADYDYTTGLQSNYITRTPELDKVISRIAPNAEIALKFSQPALLKTDTDFSGIYFTAFDTGHDDTFERSNIVAGTFPNYTTGEHENDIVISQATASALGLSVSDKVNCCFFINDAVKSRRYTIAGIYDTGFGEYDSQVAYASISAMQKLCGVDSLTGTKIDIMGFDLTEVPETAANLQQTILEAYSRNELAKLYPVDNVTHTGAVYLSWLSLLDTNVIVIFILMLCVAAFTLVSSMFIIILERIRAIGVLRSLGASSRQISNIFVYMALRIVGIGMIIGNAIAISLLYIQKIYHIVPLDQEMYYLKYVPVDISWVAIISLNIGVVIASWLILILPSKMAARISPAVTMRFE